MKTNSMSKQTFNIPEGAKLVTLEQDGDKVVTNLFMRYSQHVFDCIGDMADGVLLFPKVQSKS